jgi:hypothetical protein
LVGITGLLLAGALGLFGGSLAGRANIAVGGEQHNETASDSGGLLGMGGDLSSLLMLGIIGMPLIQGFMSNKGSDGSTDDDMVIIINEDDDDGDD